MQDSAFKPIAKAWDDEVKPKVSETIAFKAFWHNNSIIWQRKTPFVVCFWKLLGFSQIIKAALNLEMFAVIAYLAHNGRSKSL